ncbi:hypothetical protein M9458_028242, partial [Cirrhinus mrigala]
DAFDAMGYFHLALAAALEDKESLSTLYIIYMKLAEIHANYIPDAELSKSYMERAQSLKKELAGYTDSSNTEETHEDPAEAESDTHTKAGRTLTESSMTNTSLTINAQEDSENILPNTSHKEDKDTNVSEETDMGPPDQTNPLAETSCADNTSHT